MPLGIILLFNLFCNPNDGMLSYLFSLLFRLRGGLARDLYGINHQGLFTKACSGTKLIIEQYTKVVCKGLHYICQHEG